MQYFQLSIPVPLFKLNLGSNSGPYQQYRPPDLAPQQQAKLDPTMEAAVQDLKTQIGQLATAVNELIQQKSSAIPSQPMVNPETVRLIDGETQHQHLSSTNS